MSEGISLEPMEENKEIVKNMEDIELDSSRLKSLAMMKKRFIGLS